MRLCIINTGGTISCVGEPLAPMSAPEFARASREILDPVIAEAFPDTELHYETELRFPESKTGTLDSTNLQPRDWVRMARFILENYSKFSGFVLLHGTDSMDFTGSALPFLLNVVDAEGFGRAVLSKPVIVTGSQLPMFHEGRGGALTLNVNTDAFQNFCGAVACARLGIPEVGVFFDTHLFRGNRVLKVNASEFAAFDSPNCPPLALSGIELTLYPERMLPGPVSPEVSLGAPAAMALARAQLDAVEGRIDACPVMPFPAFPAAYTSGGPAVIAGLIDAVVGQKIAGLVLESYGEGNFPSGDPDNAENGSIYKALHAANAAGLVIVNATQVIAGTVNDSAYAAGAWLPKVGAISASDMTPMAAMAKTAILLAAAEHHGWSRGTVRRLIERDLAGELTPITLLDSRRNAQLLPGQALMALDGSATLANDPASGPLLADSAGAALWGPFGTTSGKPGRLVMQDDGNLVLRSAANEALWASGTGQGSGASSVLRITGSAGDGTLRLGIYDYAAGRETACLFSQTA